jgi:hypothetical protein
MFPCSPILFLLRTGLHNFCHVLLAGSQARTLQEKVEAAPVSQVRSVVGPIATPDKLQFAPGLPKTWSGKIMRRILLKIVHDQADELGNASSLADPTVVENLVKERVTWHAGSLPCRLTDSLAEPILYADGCCNVAARKRGQRRMSLHK